ncbi:MAG: alkaline phosphatase family protein [Bacteroidota bacterium]
MGTQKSVIFFFLDGVGIGRKDSSSNPFFAGTYPTIQEIFCGSIPSLEDDHRTSYKYSTVPLDATLGVPGYPQSGTGQTALLTGINAAQHIGKHFGPHPYSLLRPIIKEHNIFAKLHSLGRSVLFANAYPQKYFEYIAQKPGIVGANALAWLLSNFDLKNHNDLLTGNALSADITNERWKRMGYPEISEITPYEAGERLAVLSQKYNFVMFEYYQTDKAGHAQSMYDAIKILTMLDDMLKGILDNIDMERTLLLLTSDHGNMEDLSTRTHTLNPVPLIAAGNDHAIIHGKNSIIDVAPIIVDFLS